MFGCCQSGSGLDRVWQRWDAQNDGFRRGFGAKSRGSFQSGFAQRTRQAQYARQSAHFALLAFGKLRENSVLFLGLRAAMIADCGKQNMPVMQGKTRRFGEPLQKLVGRFLRRLLL